MTRKSCIRATVIVFAPISSAMIAISDKPPGALANRAVGASRPPNRVSKKPATTFMIIMPTTNMIVGTMIFLSWAMLERNIWLPIRGAGEYLHNLAHIRREYGFAEQDVECGSPEQRTHKRTCSDFIALGKESESS